MVINYGWIGLNRAAHILGISKDELIDAVFESWAPPHEFTRTHAIRFRWTDVWRWKLADGWRHRTYRQDLLYGQRRTQA